MPFGKAISVYRYLLDVKERKGAGFLVLMDPDRAAPDRIREQALRCAEAGVDAILVGSSLLLGNGFESVVRAVRDAADIPVIIFPGEKSQVTPEADAILFLSLLSGRNPEFIIGEQVRSAPIIRSIGLEAISTAYLLVDSGKVTSVEYMSNTRPIPADKPEIAVAHAMAAELFGMKMLYLEAGSGASRSVPDDMIRAVASHTGIPVIVGGGIRDPRTVAVKVSAGASFVVVGNHFEGNGNDHNLEAFVAAAHFRG